MVADGKTQKASEAGTVEFEDAVALTGYGRYQIGLLITCGGCLSSVIMETMSMSYILPSAQCDLNLSLSEKGMLSGSGFLGVVLSSHLWGFIGDTLGRRKLLLITTYISFIMSLLSSLSPSVWFFIILRFLNGFFIGGASAVIYAYLGEFHDNARRPRALSWAATFIAVAAILLPAIAWGVLPMTWSFHIPILEINMRPWRLLVLLYGLPTLVFATSLLTYGESPKFLWNQGKHDEALQILRSVYSCNTGNPEQMYPVMNLAESTERPAILKELDTEDANCPSKTGRIFKLMWHQTVPLLKFPFLSNTVMTSLLQFGTFASSSGFLMWLPEILNKLNMYMEVHPNSTLYTCEALEATSSLNLMNQDVIMECTDTVNEEVFKISLIFGVIFAINYLIAGSVITYIGKKLLLIIMLSISGVAGCVTYFTEGYTWIMVATVIFVSGGTCVSVINTVVVDLFPTQYRGMAMALSLMMGRLGAVAGSHLVGYLLEYYCPIAFFAFGGEMLVLVVVTLVLPIPIFIFKKNRN